LLNAIELVPAVKPVILEKGWEKNVSAETVFARIEVQNIVIPYSMFALIEPHIVRLDYDYIGSKKCWTIHGEQKISVSPMHKDDLTAMHVAKKLES
jgi:hypothetical protein